MTPALNPQDRADSAARFAEVQAAAVLALTTRAPVADLPFDAPQWAVAVRAAHGDQGCLVLINALLNAMAARKGGVR
jgi:hypothetical protein